MATAAEVVAAIDHITRYKPDWRGTLNDADFAALNDMYQRAKVHPEEWLVNRDLPTTLDDKYLGALRLDNPTLFNGATAVDPPGTAPVTQQAGVDGAPPAAPGQSPAPAPADDSFSGKAAEASKRVDEALAKNQTALAEADEELVDAVLGAKTGSDEGKAQLQALQTALVDQIHKLGPTLDTPAGQQQLNDFLQGKTQEILGIVKSSGMDAESKTEVLDALAQRYDAVKDSAGTGTGLGPRPVSWPRALSPGQLLDEPANVRSVRSELKSRRHAPDDFNTAGTDLASFMVQPRLVAQHVQRPDFPHVPGQILIHPGVSGGFTT